MPTSSYFRYWFDTEYRQRRDIDATSDEIHALDDQATQQAIATISMHTQIAELSATVSVLMKMLAEAGQLDMKVLRYRVEAELDARHAPTEPEPPATMPTEIACAKCGKKVPPPQTIMTVKGAICDPSCTPS
jgi:hypothetical protein